MTRPSLDPRENLGGVPATLEFALDPDPRAVEELSPWEIAGEWIEVHPSLAVSWSEERGRWVVAPRPGRVARLLARWRGWPR